jgi:hypothetical protein
MFQPVVRSMDIHHGADAAEKSNIHLRNVARYEQASQDTDATDYDYNGMCGVAEAIHPGTATPHLSDDYDYSRVVLAFEEAATEDW